MNGDLTFFLLEVVFMAVKDYLFSFTPVSPLTRSDAEIAVDLNASGRATDATQALLAEVESHLAQGDNF